MTLFFASISIVCAAVVGLAAGIVVGIRVMARLTRGMHRETLKNAALATPVAVEWAYDQVDKRIKDGATLDQLQDFLVAEGDRLAESVNNPQNGKAIWDAGADDVSDTQDHSSGAFVRDERVLPSGKATRSTTRKVDES